MITVARVMSGGAADRSGLIHVGDEIHEVGWQDFGWWADLYDLYVMYQEAVDFREFHFQIVVYL